MDDELRMDRRTKSSVPSTAMEPAVAAAAEQLIGEAQPAPPAPLLLIMALCGGVLGWWSMDWLPYARMPDEVVHELYRYDSLGQRPPQELIDRYEWEYLRVSYTNVTLAFGALGMCLGTMTALAAAASRRSLRIGIAGLLAGAGLGSAFGGLGGVGGLLTLDYLQPPSHYSLVPSLASRVVSSALLGLGIGLGVGVLSARWSMLFRTAITAGLAGVIAGMVFDPISSCVFPLIDSATPIPSGKWNRLMWIAIAAGLIGGITPMSGRKRAGIRAV